jgi:hypothetical protein
MSENKMHMMLETPSKETVYLVFDFDAQQVIRAVPM